MNASTIPHRRTNTGAHKIRLDTHGKIDEGTSKQGDFEEVHKESNQNREAMDVERESKKERSDAMQKRSVGDITHPTTGQPDQY